MFHLIINLIGKISHGVAQTGRIESAPWPQFLSSWRLEEIFENKKEVGKISKNVFLIARYIKGINCKSLKYQVRVFKSLLLMNLNRYRLEWKLSQLTMMVNTIIQPRII